MKKKTYGQKWTAYNAAQVHEKAEFLRLLHDLCSGVVEPSHCLKPRRGRPHLPIGDILFSMAFKVYSRCPGRRFMTDLSQAHDQGLISRLPQYNSLLKYFGIRGLGPYLFQLIIESSLPLKHVETDFAVDSTGFSTSSFGRWIDVRFGSAKIIDKRKWLKVHLICGVSTNIVTSVEVSDAYAGDSPYFKPLFEVTTQNFGVKTTVGDKAYSSLENLRLVVDNGAMPFIPFRLNTKPVHSSGDPLWTRLFHFYAYNKDWFKAHYHKRSNIESTNRMIKQKFGKRLQSRTRVAQVNELLCKVLCHNICVLVQSMYELDVKPTFWTDEDKSAKAS